MKTYSLGTILVSLALISTGPACRLDRVDPPKEPAVEMPDGGTPPMEMPDGGMPPMEMPDGGNKPVLDTLEDGTYKRGSLAPLFQLLASSEFDRFDMFEFAQRSPLKVQDFQSGAALVLSMTDKIDELARQIQQESGGARPDLIKTLDERIRGQQIPFRGNPSDVDFLTIEGQTKILVPLGGDFTTPGNEVAIANPDDPQDVTRVDVGIRPQRIAVHEPSNLAFVCNQFSNYVSIIDVEEEDLVRQNGKPVEIPTHFYCTDIAIVDRDPVAPNADEIDVYIANQWRAAVLKYEVDLVRNPVNNKVINITVNSPGNDDSKHIPTKTFTGLGRNPFRLAFNGQNRIYVANNRGGEIGFIDLSNDSTRRRTLQGPTPAIIEVDNRVYVATTTPFRGLLNRRDAQPNDVQFTEVLASGLDGQNHVVHPGSMFDDTSSYNFEDLRNGIFELDRQLSVSQPLYYTDDSEADKEFQAEEKILAGAVPLDMAFTRNGERLFVAMSSSDLVQELAVVAGTFSLEATGNVFETEERPFALAINDQGGRNDLYVVNWGGETLQVFDMDNPAQAPVRIDLGYAEPNYPATNIERGEYVYYNADWSNDQDKACASCHIDELLTDGIGYANGATAPTAFHQVKPNYNLLTTENYFWNGSFTNNSYASLAFAAQSRTNCELILFGFIEGPASDPATRVGDADFNFTSDVNVVDNCRPDFSVLNEDFPDLPANFTAIAAQISIEKNAAAVDIANSVADVLGAGVDRIDMSRFSDFYGVAELRLPPNALAHMVEAETLSADTINAIKRGKELFETTAACANCHDPNNTRAPFTDNGDHGAGVGWLESFITEFNDDPVLREFIPDGLIGAEIPFEIVEAAQSTRKSSLTEINVHHQPLDYFQPFCFDIQHCLVFRDPLVSEGEEQDQRLRVLAQINLIDLERGFMPGQPLGATRVNTPSLRGVWLQHNLLRHGLAFSIREAILAPGHKALRDDEKGWSYNRQQDFNAHGATATLNSDEVNALVLYVQSIE